MFSRVMNVSEVTVRIDNTDPSNSILYVAASGHVNSSGWTNPEISARAYINPPEDGILDLDFLAKAPNGMVLWVVSPISASVKAPAPNWIKGVRVHSATNQVEKLLSDETAEIRQPSTNSDDVFPWPWVRLVAK